MAEIRTAVCCLHFIIWLTQQFHCQAGSCGPRKPVMTICTDDELLMQTSATIDTVRVPTFQQTSCKCTISPYRNNTVFSFSYYREQSRNMDFKINGVLLSEEYTELTLMDKTDLLITTTEDYNVDGVCLIVSSADTKFNVSCTKTTKTRTSTLTSTSMKDVTTSDTFISSSTTEIATESTTEQHMETDDNEDKGFIIPVVVSLSVFSCVVVVVVVILCKRTKVSSKRKSAPPSPPTAENENDYYMTENPMYNMTSENEYNYIEHENEGSRPMSNQYESLPDPPVKAQTTSKPTILDQHYDHTKGSSANKTYKQTNGKHCSMELKQERSFSDTGETLYDRTDVPMKQCHSVNEYSHINTKAIVKNVSGDTYNTIGNTCKS